VSELDIETLLAGELGPDELAELERRLRADPALLEEAMASYRLRQLLPLALRGRGGDRFAEAVARSLKPPSEGFAMGVERSVRRRVARKRRRGALWLLPLAAAAAIAAAVALRWSSPAPVPVPLPAPIAPSVAVSADDVPVVAVAGGDLRQGEVIGFGREITLPAAASATLRWADGSALALAGEARLRVVRAAGKRIEIERGAVACSAAHQPDGRPFAISTPHGEATIVGTRFVLEVGATTLLRVSDGAVRLRDRANGAESVVHAGEEKRIGPPQLPYVQDFLTGLPTGWQLGELYEEPAGDWWRSVTSVERQDRGRASWCISSEAREHQHPFFRFDPRASIELTLAQDRPAQDLLLLVLCRADTGAYVANVMIHVDVPDRPAFQAVRVPFAKAYEGLDRVGDVPAVCTSWLLQSFDRDQRPRLARIAVLPP
jgi:ferric-dicitrate binding protein FerR (iron transport regulator)